MVRQLAPRYKGWLYLNPADARLAPENDPPAPQSLVAGSCLVSGNGTPEIIGKIQVGEILFQFG